MTLVKVHGRVLIYPSLTRHQRLVIVLLLLLDRATFARGMLGNNLALLVDADPKLGVGDAKCIG